MFLWMETLHWSGYTCVEVLVYRAVGFLSVPTLEWLHMWWSTRVLSCRFFSRPWTSSRFDLNMESRSGIPWRRKMSMNWRPHWKQEDQNLFNFNRKQCLNFLSKGHVCFSIRQIKNPKYLSKYILQTGISLKMYSLCFFVLYQR